MIFEVTHFPLHSEIPAEGISIEALFAGRDFDVDAAQEALHTRAFQQAVDLDWQRSRQVGITGVPTYVIGDRAVSGAQPYEVLEQFVVESGGRRR